jgi:hypothetical protein
MSNLRWLEELTKTYTTESVGQPSNINEELLQEQEEYISILEESLVTIIEELNIDVESLIEAVQARKTKSSGVRQKPLSPQQLKALGMTRTGERMAARGTGGGKAAIASRTTALNKLEKIAGTTQGRALLKKIG